MLKGLLKGSKSKRAKDAPLLPEGVRLYAIGDIHGRADLLEKLFAQLRADIKGGDFNQLHFVFLGDYIDRGFQSREVIEIILSQEWGGWQASAGQARSGHARSGQARHRACGCLGWSRCASWRL